MRSLMNKIMAITLSLLVCITHFSLTTFAIEGEDTANKNLALNKPVTYSGVEGGKKADGSWVYPQFVGEKVVDGDAATRWSADKTDDQWLTIDLEDVYNIGAITMNFHAESPEYEILIAGEDQVFTAIANVNDGSKNGAAVTKTFDGKGEKARYIKYHQKKMWLHSSNGKYYSSSVIDIDVKEAKSTDITVDTLRVGTFNIAANKKFDIAQQSALTSEYNLEIVGLQEVDRFTPRNDFDMLESFKTGGGYSDSYYSKTIPLGDGEYGIGTVSKYPLRDQSTTKLSWDGKAEERVYQRSVFTKNGREVAFYNTHLSYETTELRFQQMEQLKTAINNDPVEYKIIVGDFNADQSRDEFNRFLDEVDMCNGYYGKWYDTFNGVDATMKVNSVDNILVTRNLQIDDVAMVPTKLSDHNLLTATLTFLDEPAVSFEWLRAVLDNAKQIKKGPYSDESYDALQAAIIAANAVYTNSNATQAEINEEVGHLQNAINALAYMNLAYGKDVTYSGVEGDKVGDNWKYPQFVGEKAVDGDMTSRWSAAKKDNQDITVDLGEVMEISEVLLYFHAESPDYEVLVSEDGKTFTSVFHETNGTQGDTVRRQISFPMQEVRYVKYAQNKMWKHSNGSFYGSSLFELEVYTEFSIASIDLEKASDVISIGETLALQAIIQPELASHKEITFTSDNEDVATVDANGVITGVSVGKAVITVASKDDPAIQTTKTIQVVDGNITVQEFRFDPSSITLTARDKRFLSYNVYPENAVNPDVDVTWSSSDEAIARVDENGYLQTLAEGDVIITVQSVEDSSIKGTLAVHVTKPTYSESYDTMKDRWQRRVIGEDLDLNDPDIAAYVANIDSEGQALWASMYKNSDRTTLWDKLSSDTVSADYTTQFTKLKKLTLAFAVEGSSLYHNPDLLSDIVSGIDFMVVNKKYNGTYSTGNWWDWQIGCTQPLVDMLMVLSDYTDYANIEPAVKAVEGYAKKPSVQWPSYTATGANRTDIGLSVLGSAIVAKNDDRMNLVKNEVPDVMKLVTSGDGLYADGSVVQHTKHAYTGSYGNELLKGVGRIQSIISGTEFDIVDPRIENVYNTISKGYIPLMHKGQMLSMVNGRSISRAPGTNPFTTEFEAGSETISNIMLLANSAPEAYRNEFLAAIKGWLLDSQDNFNFYGHARDFDALLEAKAIVNNDAINTDSYTGMHVYGSMDRVVQANDDYTAGLSMYSSRIYNYEFGNTENKKGWHTADGMLYIYNNDLLQYGEGYWPTVDPYRLPGTTVDTKSIADGAAYNKTSPQSWTGGVTDGTNGAAGMYYNASNLGLGMDVKAQKSWFFLDGKIVALGANINGTTDASIETTIENRMITGNNPVSINGTPWDETASEKTLKAGDYVHMSGTGEGNDIGYYFPQDETLQVSKETRTGKYSDINEYFVNDKTYENSFFKMGINHGKKVENDTYEYVLLPGATEDETKAFAKKNSLLILRNDADVQAVKDTDSGIFAMNTWPENDITVNGITVNNSASIYTQTKGGFMDVYVSDPKQKNVTLKVTLGDGYQEVVSMDKEVTVNEDGSFNIDTTRKAGASLHFRVKLNKTEDTTNAKKVLNGAIVKAEAAMASDEFAILAPDVANMIRARYAEAKAVYNNEKATNTECLTAWKNLADALHYMNFTADKAMLNTLIKECQELNMNDYIAGVEAFNTALANAISVYESNKVLQPTINAAYTALENAKKALVKKSDSNREHLTNMIAFTTTNIGDGSAYRHDAFWNAYQDALANANNVLANEQATPEAIQNAIMALAGAYEDLRLTPDESLLNQLDKFIAYVNNVDLARYNAEDAAYIKDIQDQAIALRSDIHEFEESTFYSLVKEFDNVKRIVEENAMKDPGATDLEQNPGTVTKPEDDKKPESSTNTKAPVKGTATGDVTNASALLAVMMLSGCGLYAFKKRRKK